jgi:hypothetical protein
MSLTSAIWAGLFVLLPALSVGRAAWAIPLYMLTFFAAPQLWWWGDQLPDLRYSLTSGFVLVVAAILGQTQPEEGRRHFGLVQWAVVGMVVNAVFVHLFLAAGPSHSQAELIELTKFCLLFFMMSVVIKTKADLRLAFIAMALGAGYIGYEVTINERGTFRGGRLEGVGAPGADTANSLASLLMTTLPFTGSLLSQSGWTLKALVAVAAPLALNVIILCNSRGAFLALIGSGVSFVLISRGQTRKNALKALALGAVALYMLMGDPEIVQRFATTFTGAEERDASASSRLEFWKAGWELLKDRPLGAGGGAFKYVLGERYLQEFTTQMDSRSLHNGYLTIATSWGVQGLVLHLIFVLAAMAAAYRTSEACRRAGLAHDALIGICVIVGGIGLLIGSVFGSFLPNEWCYWLVAYLVRYSAIYKPETFDAIAREPEDAPAAA